MLILPGKTSSWSGGGGGSVSMSLIDVANLGNFGDTTASGNTVAFGAGDTVYVLIQYIPVSGATFTMDIAGTAASIMTWDPGTGTEDANLTLGSAEYEVWSASVSGTPTNDVSITATGELNAVVITVARASGLTSITDFVVENAVDFTKATSFDITSGGRSFGMHYSGETAKPTSITGSVDSYTNDTADFISGVGTGFEVTADHSSTTTETVTITGPDDTLRTVAVVSLS